MRKKLFIFSICIFISGIVFIILYKTNKIEIFNDLSIVCWIILAIAYLIGGFLYYFWGGWQKEVLNKNSKKINKDEKEDVVKEVTQNGQRDGGIDTTKKDEK